MRFRSDLIPDHLILWLGDKPNGRDLQKGIGGGWYLHKELGIDPDIIEFKLNRSRFDDLIDYGTGLFTYWLTDKGKATLESMNENLCGNHFCPICYLKD